MVKYHLGLPAWAFPGWNGHYFDNQPSSLGSYARVFNTVEGNTTFYSMPDKNTVSAWQRAVDGADFQFCFKLPREVTHQQHPDLNLMATFCQRITPLQPHLGPLLLQFPSTVGPQKIRLLESIAAQVPESFRAVVEVRHIDFFKQSDALTALLRRHGFGLAVMDSRAVFHGNQSHPEVRSALHEKPDVPVWNQVYNQLLFVRLLLHPDLFSNAQYLQQWVRRAATALQRQCEVYMMIHCPNNQHCPPLALKFHDLLREEINQLAPLNPWPVPQQSRLLE